MKLKNFFSLVVLSFMFLQTTVSAKENFFTEGVKLFEQKKYLDSKFKFEQDIVFNPKSENSYLYLSKIFKEFDRKDLQEQNLNTVILLNPQNEEAIYSLAKLKLENSDYKMSLELNEKLINMCNKFCIESKKLKVEIESLSKK